MMKKHLSILIGCIALMTSCIDYNDATEAISVGIQVTAPDDYPKANLQGHVITLSGARTFTATTDAQGIAHFDNIVPDVYNASASWKIGAEEYEKTTGKTVDNKKQRFTIAGSLTAQTFGTSTTAPVAMTTTISQDQSILIGKVYYQGNKDDNGKSYTYAKYLELYNNSDEEYDVAGLYIALLESGSKIAYPIQYITDSIIAKQVFQIPASESFKVAPGETVLLANSAVDHTTKGSSNDPNLLDADFEAKDLNSARPHENNPAVPALIQLFTTYSAITYLNLAQGGPCGIAIFETSEDVAGDWVNNNLTYAYGTQKGMQYMKIPTRFIIDAVDILKYNSQTGVDPNTKRLFDYLDAGYAYTEATAYDGRLVRRKVASTTADGRKILQDTNNSANDFESTDQLTPRVY